MGSSPCCKSDNQDEGKLTIETNINKTNKLRTDTNITLNTLKTVSQEENTDRKFLTEEEDEEKKKESEELKKKLNFNEPKLSKAKAHMEIEDSSQKNEELTERSTERRGDDSLAGSAIKSDVGSKKSGTKKKKKPYEFNLQNKGKELRLIEMELAERKKEILEKISFKMELQNLDKEHHKNKEFLIEVLFTNTEIQDESSFFTIGHTSRKKKKKDITTIEFPEDFVINFLFERTQYLKLIINSSDGKTSEVTINLAKVITSKLADLCVPVALLKQKKVDFQGNHFDQYSQHLVMKFERVTEFLDKIIPAFYVEYNFFIASQVATRLRYEIIIEKDNGDMKVVYKSNELMGKNPLHFSAATFYNRRELFEDNCAQKFVFEFYENDHYYGQAILPQEAMMKLLQSPPTSKGTPFAVTSEGKQLHATEANKSLIKLGSSKSNTNLSQQKSNKNLSKQSSNKKLEKVNPREFEMGRCYITFRENKRKKFYDLLMGGLNTAFDIAIDFTSSNGDPGHDNSLHTLKLEHNKYAKAVTSCGNILKEYDDDQLFPVYGFGGRPEGGKEVSHCFNLNNLRDARIDGMDKVIYTYLDMIKTIQFVGPTYFHPVLKAVLDSIKKEIKKGNKNHNPLTYHVCLILTDGKVDDMNETIEILIEAAKYPISVIIVGIGSDDFIKMETLDGNEIPLTSPETGELIYRDIVQFVNFSELEDQGTKLAAKVLEAIPIQIEEFFRIEPLSSK